MYCDGADYWNDNSSAEQTVVVGSLVNCVTSTTGYAGVYDLSGNVWEWEDNCDYAGQSASCRIRGGSFLNDSGGLACGFGYPSTRGEVEVSIGFRCCSQ
jgi:formylglycine-generating enzyme required for sulfatase activity